MSQKGGALCQCGNIKSPGAKQCRDCYGIYMELVGMGLALPPSVQYVRKTHKASSYDTCPTCGGQKTKKAKQCIVCHYKSLPKPDIVCPLCGGRKDPRAHMCQKCRMLTNPPKFDIMDGHHRSKKKKPEAHISDAFYGVGIGGKRNVPRYG